MSNDSTRLKNGVVICQHEYLTLSTREDTFMKILDQDISKPFHLSKPEKELLESTLTVSENKNSSIVLQTKWKRHPSTLKTWTTRFYLTFFVQCKLIFY